MTYLPEDPELYGARHRMSCLHCVYVHYINWPLAYCLCIRNEEHKLVLLVNCLCIRNEGPWSVGPKCTFVHDNVIKWKHFLHYWPFVWGIHRSPVNSHRKGQWRGALMFSLICASTNGWVNNRYAGDLRRHRAHYDVTVMHWDTSPWQSYLDDTPVTLLFGTLFVQLVWILCASWYRLPAPDL